MIILLILLTFFGVSHDSPGKDKRTLLLVFAHPDDELAIAPALSKLSKDYSIYAVYATDGKGGTRVKNIPPDSLGMIRIEEAKCSLAKLGLEPPIFLHVDRLDSKFSLAEFWKQVSVAKDSLKHIILRIRPDAIIAAGPDGDTGHPEHRVISSLTTEVLLREGWVEQYPLYYFLWTKQQVDHFSKMGIDDIMYVSDRYVNLTVKFSEEDQRKSWDAMKCHQSQYSEQEIEKSMEIDKLDTVKATYFRRFVVDKVKRKDF
jgi:LmbE family N-acetylglucosaminyl deacetylase